MITLTRSFTNEIFLVISKEEKTPRFARSSSYGFNVRSMNHFAENLPSTNYENTEMSFALVAFDYCFHSLLID